MCRYIYYINVVMYTKKLYANFYGDTCQQYYFSMTSRSRCVCDHLYLCSDLPAKGTIFYLARSLYLHTSFVASIKSVIKLFHIILLFFTLFVYKLLFESISLFFWFKIIVEYMKQQNYLHYKRS